MNKVFSAKIKDYNLEPSSPKRLDTEAKEVHMVPRIICSHLFFFVLRENDFARSFMPAYRS